MLPTLPTFLFGASQELQTETAKYIGPIFSASAFYHLKSCFLLHSLVGCFPLLFSIVRNKKELSDHLNPSPSIQGREVKCDLAKATYTAKQNEEQNSNILTPTSCLELWNTVMPSSPEELSFLYPTAKWCSGQEHGFCWWSDQAPNTGLTSLPSHNEITTHPPERCSTYVT